MILNENLIRHAAVEARQNRYILESVQYSSYEEYDLFISHSFSDKNLVTGLEYLFDKAGYKVYIDWIDDPNLDRNNVTKQTAEIIKNRLKNCKALAYISTENIISSKWCPWELGLADGLHNGKACILPVMNNTFKGQEYLNLYSYVEYSVTERTGKMDFLVYDSEDRSKCKVLSEWLTDT